MKLLLLVVCIQLCCSMSPPFEPPEPVLLSASCKEPSVVGAANLAVDDMNSKRKEGYVFTLNRVADAHEQRVGTTGTVYYLKLELLETVCHTLSKRSAKDCAIRDHHQTVYGQCNTTYYLNRPGRVARLYNYKCIFNPASGKKIHHMCPDCPVASNPNEPIYLETAERTLEKFNNESNQTNYFAILNVTKASMQWVVGPSHFVEYTIQETRCSKDTSDKNVSHCELMNHEIAHFGLCKGSIMKSIDQEYISVSCEIYEPEKHQEDHDGEDHKHHPEKKGHKGHGHHHPHRRHFGHDHKHPHSPIDSPVYALPVGPIEVLPTIEILPAVDPAGSCIPPEEPPSSSIPSDTSDGVQKPMPLPFYPVKPNGPPYVPPFLLEPQILPFPETHSESDQCPGDFKHGEPLFS